MFAIEQMRIERFYLERFGQRLCAFDFQTISSSDELLQGEFSSTSGDAILMAGNQSIGQHLINPTIRVSGYLSVGLRLLFLPYCPCHSCSSEVLPR